MSAAADAKSTVSIGTTGAGGSTVRVVEEVAGTDNGESRPGMDGTLRTATFLGPMAVCKGPGDSLFVVDHHSNTIREVIGVLGVANPMVDDAPTDTAVPEFEARAVPLLMAAVAVLPKELAQLTAQYALPGGRVRTIAGSTQVTGSADGPALDGALFSAPQSCALDTTDPVAGPQLLIGEYAARRLRCLNLRTRLVTTITGQPNSCSRSDLALVDGPAQQARFASLYGIVVAPNGVLFVSDLR